VLRASILAASRSDRLRETVAHAPYSRDVVARFVAGEGEPEAVDTAVRLAAQGLYTTIDRLGEDVLDAGAAQDTVHDYVRLLSLLDEAGMAAYAEVSVKLSAVGQALGADGDKIALDNARTICAKAAEVGTTVTLDMEDHTTTDSTLSILRDLRADFPSTGAVLQAYLHRTEADARDLAFEGSRVRLCKGAYKEPASVAFQTRADVDLSYVRCMRILMEGPGYPMLATHDPRLIQIAGALAVSTRRAQGTYEYQMLHGVRPGEQMRLSEQGERVRVYVPYGQDWWGYLMRRMAEKPGNLALFLRSLVSRG
jgi:proline dehydrogenase